MTVNEPGERKRVRKKRRRRSRRRIVGYVALGFLGVLVVGAVLLAMRYLPYLDRAREAKASAQQLAAAVRALDVDVSQQDLDGLRSRIDDVDARLQPFRDLLAGDLLVDLARNVGSIREQVDGAAAAVSAADELVGAARIGLNLGQRFVDIRARADTTTDGSTLASLVELIAISTTDVDRISAHLTSAREQLAKVPANATGDVREAHDLMAGPLAEYAPVLESYAQMDDTLPAILGWGGQKRYLVLAQDPAELRPHGGFSGTYGLVTFADGRLTDHEFHDIYLLDLKPGLPYQEPPLGLKSHLLGNDRSWQLADALWSPDLPTAAQDAMRLYELESGGDQVDGLITITTYAIDELLKIIGPVEVRDYGVTVHPGEVTLTSLAQTRAAPNPDVNRKQFLQELATSVLDRLYALPATQWPALLERMRYIGDHRLANAWFKDAGAQDLVAGSTWSGELLQVPGDYLFVVDSNVAPASKYNLVVTRSLNLLVEIDEFGNAHNTLQITWQNDSMKAGEPYASLRSWSTGSGAIYGNYVRVIVPDRSRLQGVAGGSFADVTAPEELGTIAGRSYFANYIAVPPGTAALTYSWISPYPVYANQGVGEDGEATYALTIQKQPGMTDEPISVTITVPGDLAITAASEGFAVQGNIASYAGSVTADLQLAVQYGMSR